MLLCGFSKFGEVSLKDQAFRYTMGTQTKPVDSWQRESAGFTLFS